MRGLEGDKQKKVTSLRINVLVLDKILFRFQENVTSNQAEHANFRVDVLENKIKRSNFRFGSV